VKLVHLVGFIIKKFVTMHGHMNVKKSPHIKSRLKVFDRLHLNFLAKCEFMAV